MSNEYKAGVERCGFTGKQIFTTKDAARAALRGWAGSKGSKQVMPRCIACDGYHLTKGVRGRKMRGK